MTLFTSIFSDDENIDQIEILINTFTGTDSDELLLVQYIFDTLGVRKYSNDHSDVIQCSLDSYYKQINEFINESLKIESSNQSLEEADETARVISGAVSMCWLHMARKSDWRFKRQYVVDGEQRTIHWLIDRAKNCSGDR